METLAIGLMLSGAIVQGSHVVVNRYLIQGERVLTGHEALFVQYLIRSSVLLAILPFWGDWGTTAAYNSKLFLVAVAGVILTNLWIQHCNATARSLPKADVSLTEPVQSLTPGLVTITAMVFNEFPTWQGLAGIGLITLGLIKHSREDIPITSREFWKPFAMFRLPANYSSLTDEKKDEACQKVRAVRWSYGSAIGGSFGLLFDALVVRSGSVVLGFCLQGVVLGSIFGLAGKKGKGPLFARIGEHKRMIILMGLLWTLMVLLTNTAFRLEAVAYIGSMKRLYLPFAMLFAFIFLGEQKAKHRAGPVLVMTTGAVLLALDGVAGRLVDRLEFLLQ